MENVPAVITGPVQRQNFFSNLWSFTCSMLVSSYLETGLDVVSYQPGTRDTVGILLVPFINMAFSFTTPSAPT
jgi:hypothetical protein